MSPRIKNIEIINNKKIYREFCKKENSINLFSHTDWLDATVGNKNWNVSIVFEGSNIVATMPYFIRNLFLFKEIGTPRMTPKLGPWLKKNISISDEFKYINSLFDQLPKYTFFKQNWDTNLTYWQPLYWRGYKQTTGYTYVLDNLENLDKIYNNFSSTNQRQIKKAQRNMILIEQEDNFNKFLYLQNKTFKRQNYINFNKQKYLKKIDDFLKKKNKRKIFFARDKFGKYHSCVYIAWDNNVCYYLMGGGDPALRNSGAGNLCMWHAIKFASTVSKSFDFEGSMIKSIDHFFRQFGAEPKQYFSITKINSIFYMIALSLKPTVKEMITKFIKFINIYD